MTLLNSNSPREETGDDAQVITPTTNWRCVTDSSNFERLKADVTFRSVITLARIVNALRFVHTPLVDNQDRESPSALRTRYNSFFFNCSLFYEASLFVQNLPGPHRTMQEFQAMAVIINSSEARTLRYSSLESLRNKFVFHFDVAEMGKQVQKLEYPAFMTAIGGTNGDVYYEMADACVVEAFKEGGGATTDEDIHQLMEQVTRVTLNFINAAELFLTAYLRKEGWRAEVVS